jgi:biotin carboxyl carrier protein
MKFVWRGKVHDVRVSGKKVTVTPAGGEPRVGEVEAGGVAVRARGGVWVSAAGWNVFLETARPDAAKRAGADEIRSPMTGRVVSVPVKPGASVRHGTVLVVITAMKMEFRVEAPHDGVVESVECAVDELVDLGKILVVLKT